MGARDGLPDVKFGGPRGGVACPFRLELLGHYPILVLTEGEWAAAHWEIRRAAYHDPRRQGLFSTDLIYDVLRKHQPDHVLLRAARADAAQGLLDIRRLSDMLLRIKGRIVHRELDRISPLAVPVMLEIGREAVYGEASDELLAEAAAELVKEATG